MHVVADPKDPNTVYVLNVDFHRSIDGGRTFNKIKVPHGDNHGLWIDPQNTRRMIQTDDGGATVTVDGGAHWTRQDNQPTAQFYHVVADNRFPYYLYGSQQDNSSVAIATRGSQGGAIEREDWYPVGGGEAGYIAPYLPDPDIVFAGDYQGLLTMFDKRTGQAKVIGASAVLSDGKGAAGLEHRFQWTAPLLISPHDPNVLYHGGERLFRTTDRGLHWEAISGDLTRNDKSKQQPSGGPITIDDTGTEYYDTIFAVAESPLANGLIWAGADDGLVHVTRDGGKNWADVTPKEMPEWSKISQIDASPHDPATAWVAVDRHANDDVRPYIYATTDYGKTWKLLVQGIPEGSFVRAVREDPKRKGLLFAGTETGVFVSYNAGANWESLQLNLPTTPVHDLLVHDNDLVLATHGRSFWILDDISPLRQSSDASRKAAVWLYDPAPAWRVHAAPAPKEAPTSGQNPPPGAVIYFDVKEKPKSASLEILDAAGKLVRRYSSTEPEPLEEPLDPDDEKPKNQLEIKPGMNRFVWDLRYQAAPRVKDYYLFEYEGGSKGPIALPGKYQVKLTVDDKALTAPLELKLDPRVKASQADLEKQFATLIEIRGELTRVYTAANQIVDLRAQLQDLRKRVKLAEVQALDEKLGALQDRLLNLKIKANEDSLNYGLGVDGSLASLALIVDSESDSTPTEAALQQFAKVKAEVEQYMKRWSDIQQSDLPALERAVEQQGVKPLMVK
jgi:photosystem II stability/assembly factor-like uncharacterized protein